MNRELQTIIVEVEKAVVGKREVIEKILMALLADGHVLLDDIPGVGKTTLAVALSRTLGLTYNRIQCWKRWKNVRSLWTARLIRCKSPLR